MFSDNRVNLTPLVSKRQSVSVDDSLCMDGEALNSTLLAHQPSQKSVIKRYMKNELERNDSETAYYENMIDEVSNTCELLRTENERLEAEVDNHLSNKALLDEEIAALRQANEDLTARLEAEILEWRTKAEAESAEYEETVASLKEDCASKDQVNAV